MTESSPEGKKRVSGFERILLLLLIAVVGLVAFLAVMVTNTNRGEEIERRQTACSAQFGSGTTAFAECVEGATE